MFINKIYSINYLIKRKKVMQKKDQIDYNCKKEVEVNTKVKNKKKTELGEKKKRRAEDDLEDLMKGDDAVNDRMLSKKFDEKMDISDNSAESEEDYDSESDPDEEVIIDEGHDDDSEEYMQDEQAEENKEEKKLKVNIWDEKTKLKEDQELDFDNEAYEMLHRSKVEWPCMTIDFMLPQNFNGPINSFYEANSTVSNDLKSLDAYPYSCYMIAGSQTNTQNGFLYYMKWYNMHKTKYDDDPDRGADSDDEEGQEPYMKYEKVQVKGNINRIKSMRNSYLAAFWSDSPSVEIVDMRQVIKEMEENIENPKKKKDEKNKNKKQKINPKNITLKSFTRKYEGFGIEWSMLTPGVLAAGGQDKIVEVYTPTDESCTNWTLNSNNAGNSYGILKGHKGSIEDIIWSPVQAHVMATCSTDKSIRFWDLRVDKNNPPIVIDNAHDSDVNCISWNHFCDFMIASGGDDNAFKVWDIRYISNGPISNILWHKSPITAISWDPFEDSQLAVSSEDNRLSIWDFSVEPDDNHLFDNANQEIPQQLIFLHQGQENIKDLKFHPLYKNFIVSTAENGVNVFKPAFDEDSSIASDEMMDIDA